MLSIADQIALMRRDWPEFRVAVETNWLVIWEGRLRPFHQDYVVRVLYCVGRDLETAEISPVLPEVTVVEPVLARRPEQPDEAIPHHFPNDARPDRPILCLYDPREREWQVDNGIAETSVPWAVGWLACYEGWRATGEWTGGGRHVTEQEMRSWIAKKKTRQNGRPGRCNAAAFNSLGRRIGTFASFPLMAAASAGSTRPHSWRDWRTATLAERPWRATSTLSPGHPPAESSLLASPQASPRQACQTCTSSAAVTFSRLSETDFSAEPDAA
jgi:hypothetical protein